jgi:hypothetical protein
MVPTGQPGDILTGSQHEGGFGLAPEVEQQPRPPGTPQEGLGIPDPLAGSQHEGGFGLETGLGGGLGDLARQAPATGMPGTQTQTPPEEVRPPGTPQEAGSQAPTEEQPRPPGTPQEAGSQQQPTVPLPTPRPAEAPQAPQAPTPSTPQTPATGQQAQQGFPGGMMNPMKFIGDILQLMGGNPTPLLSDLANQFGMGGGPQQGQQPWQGKPWQPGYNPQTGMYTDPKTGQQTQMQRAQEDARQQPQAQQPQQPQTEEQRQRQQRQQDLGQPGTYVIGDKGQRVRVQTDAKGNPMYDKKGQPIPAPEQQAPGATKQGGPLPPPWPQGKPPDYFQHHGERPGANLVRINTPYGPVTANKAAAQDFLNLTNEMKQAGVPGIDKFGSFNIRQKRYGSGYSSHSYGAAFDMNNEAGPMNPQLQNWIKQNPQQWQDMLRRNNFSQYMVQHDPNHLEWTGPRGTQTAAYPPQPLPAGQNRPPANVGGTVGPNDPYTKQLVNLESSGKRFAKTGSNYGLGQFSPDQFRHFGITDPYNPQQQYRAIAQERAENIPVARKILGREPTASELYLMHQQGQTGGANLLRAAQNNPNGPAWQTVRERGRSDGYAMRKIHGNIPSDNPLSRVPANQVTNAQFKQMWDDRFNRGGGGSRTAQTPQTPQTPQQPRIRGLDLLPGGRTAQSDGGPPIQLASLSQSTEGPQDQSRGGGEDKPYDEPPRLPMMPPYPHNDQNLPLPGNPAGWQDYGIPGAVID